MAPTKPITSITFFEYPEGSRWWAFNQMQLAQKAIRNSQGVLFSKLLGTGSGFGFSLKPDFTTYALLMVWKDTTQAQRYLQSDIYNRFKARCHKDTTYWMGCVQSHGTWNGCNPFMVTDSYQDGPIMILTRARVRLNKMHRFLKKIPIASRSAEIAEGLLFAKGIGEWPGIEQATFSLWDSLANMRAYAYQNEHEQIMQLVKKENWYKEELFARFIPSEVNS